MEKTKVKILSGYRITIPEEVRRRFSLKEGDELELTVEGNRLIYKIRGLPEDPVAAMLGITSGERRELSEAEEAVISEVEEKVNRSRK
ncbi:MAG: AbrB/MazE/SpoVT family DNA-binding domain-containing protein [Candidatus Brockarchaeota archaeon]|nr:AbrB/MazE/SpoVT family DNA-binding domain-containing protein [Candidatus Brockarchaeota archaeon]MBO3808672.1 AbrB/MazE/SpoVT family DNA-binding domain-containing protein [Candidatus Brockarchaeota archaeon]